MKCPVCKNTEHHVEFDIHINGLDEDIIECDICGTIWSVNHGMVEVVKDSQSSSFLEAASEMVECDDYSVAFA